MMPSDVGAITNINLHNSDRRGQNASTPQHCTVNPFPWGDSFLLKYNVKRVEQVIYSLKLIMHANEAAGSLFQRDSGVS